MSFWYSKKMYFGSSFFNRYFSWYFLFIFSISLSLALSLSRLVCYFLHLLSTSLILSLAISYMLSNSCFELVISILFFLSKSSIWYFQDLLSDFIASYSVVLYFSDIPFYFFKHNILSLFSVLDDCPTCCFCSAYFVVCSFYWFFRSGWFAHIFSDLYIFFFPILFKF